MRCCICGLYSDGEAASTHRKYSEMGTGVRIDLKIKISELSLQS